MTILATNAAMADAAATMVANAVNIDHPAVERRPANSLRDESDLGDIPVTVNVGTLPLFAVEEALSAGLRRAQDLRRAGLIHAAFLSLQGEHRSIGGETLLASERKAMG